MAKVWNRVMGEMIAHVIIQALTNKKSLGCCFLESPNAVIMCSVYDFAVDFAVVRSVTLLPLFILH